MMSTSPVLVGSVGVSLAALIVGCSTGGAEQRSGDCGMTKPNSEGQLRVQP